MKIGIAGLGLIGGSMAKAVKKNLPDEVYGFDLNESVMENALSDGGIDGVLDSETLKQCRIVLAALYPAACVSFVRQNLENFGEKTLLLDLCGVKQSVMEPILALSLPKGLTYIGGHPMAGIEKSGYHYADADLFSGASMILVPEYGKNTERLSREVYRELMLAESFFLSLGFGKITLCSMEEHDRMIAFTSQLAHVVSSAYIKSPAALSHFGFSAGSYRDLTRVAKLNELMWSELFLDNKDALCAEIDGIIERLCEYRDVIRDGNKELLVKLLREGRERKEGIEKE